MTHSPSSLHAEARQWVKLGSENRAADAYSSILKVNPGDAEALRYLAWHAPATDISDRSFRELQRQHPLSATDLIIWASRLAAADRHGQAEAHLSRAKAVVGTNEERIALAQAILGISGMVEAPVAVRLLDEAMRRPATTDSDEEEVPSRVALLLIRVLENNPPTGVLSQAAETLSRATQEGGDDRIRLLAAGALLQAERPDDAMQIWARIERPLDRPADRVSIVEYWRVGAEILGRVGRSEEALRMWETVVALDRTTESGEDAQIRRWLNTLLPYTRTLVELGRYRQALAEIGRWSIARSTHRFKDPQRDGADHDEPPETRQARASSLRMREVLSWMLTAVAQSGLGEHREAWQALMRARTAALGASELAEVAAYLSCTVATDVEAAEELLVQTFGSEGRPLSRDSSLTYVDSYRNLASRYPDCESRAADAVRNELATIGGAAPDAAREAAYALYAGHLNRANDAVQRIDRPGWQDDMLRAVVAIERGEFDIARTACERVLAQRPFDLDAELLSVEVERGENGVMAARASAEAVARRRPNDVGAQLLVAECCYEQATQDAPTESAARGFRRTSAERTSANESTDAPAADLETMIEAVHRYRRAIELSDSVRDFLATGRSDHEIGSLQLSSRSIQHAARRGAICAVRATVMLDRRGLFGFRDKTLRRDREELITAIGDKLLQKRLEDALRRSAFRLVLRLLRYTGALIGFLGGFYALLTIVFRLPTPWSARDTQILLLIFVLMALFPTISEFSLPGGIGLKRQLAPLIDDDEFRLREFVTPSLLSSIRSIQVSALPQSQQSSEATSSGAKEGVDVQNDRRTRIPDLGVQTLRGAATRRDGSEPDPSQTRES